MTKNYPNTRHCYLFVGGLHRSGTSLVNRLANAIPGASGITDSPAPENEGVYLQGAIPHTALHGRPMHFATNPEEHLTETHPLNNLGTKRHLEADWAPWFAQDATWRVEKSPVNLTRMRLLQQLFPMAQFVVVLRHPEAVIRSVKHWTDQDPDALFDHWIAAHQQVWSDLLFLHAVLCVRYEDIIAHPDRFLAALSAFLSADQPSLPEAIVDGNRSAHPVDQMSTDQSRQTAQWGYGPDLETLPWAPVVQHPFRSVRDAVQRALSHEETAMQAT